MAHMLTLQRYLQPLPILNHTNQCESYVTTKEADIPMRLAKTEKKLDFRIDVSNLSMNPICVYWSTTGFSAFPHSGHFVFSPSAGDNMREKNVFGVALLLINDSGTGGTIFF